MKIDYTTPNGEQRTLEDVEGLEYLGAAYLGLTEVAILQIGTDEVMTTWFEVTEASGS